VAVRTEAVPPPGVRGWGRWAWRQLTSMRTALILLFLLALASVPGSVLPQRGNNPLRVDQWLTDNPTSGPILDRLGFFDGYSSPWFASVYLLLFVSLIGCLLPRSRQHWQAVRSQPPPAPRRLARMPGSRSLDVPDGPQDVLDRAERHLRQGRWRVRAGSDDDGRSWLAAERGYLHETGNLVFHVSLLLVLAAVAIGGLFGWKGNVIVREGSGFSNTLTQYDAWGAGRFVNADDLAPFSFSLDDFAVDFERGDAQAGAPRLFEADLTYRPTPAMPAQYERVEVNSPLQAAGAKVFLVGHGYAPRFVIRDSTDAVLFDDAVVFLPQDGNFTSTGVIKVPDAQPPLGFSGIFAPTAALSRERGPFSTFPAPDYPAVFLSAFSGDLGLGSGRPQSVYTLNTDAMSQLGLESLRPGEAWTLPAGAGRVEFTGYQRWASFQIANDPGKELALIATVSAMCGLVASLSVRRRRLWIKAYPAADAGATRVEIAGLMKSGDAAQSDHDVATLVEIAAGGRSLPARKGATQ